METPICFLGWRHKTFEIKTNIVHITHILFESQERYQPILWTHGADLKELVLWRRRAMNRCNGIERGIGLMEYLLDKSFIYRSYSSNAFGKFEHKIIQVAVVRSSLLAQDGSIPLLQLGLQIYDPLLSFFLL